MVREVGSWVTIRPLWHVRSAETVPPGIGNRRPDPILTPPLAGGVCSAAMVAAPLTDDELAAMPRTAGAHWPKGVILRCQCGRIGTVGDVSSHRTGAARRDLPSLCLRDPDAFQTREDAEMYEAEDSARQRREGFEEEDRLRMEELRLSGRIPSPNPSVRLAVHARTHPPGIRGGVPATPGWSASRCPARSPPG